MTNKPMLSVERELLERIARPQLKRRDETVRRRAIAELRTLLDKQSCGACGGCDNGCKLDRESPPIEASAQHQGEPVAEVEREFDNAPAHVHLYQDLPDGTKLYAEQPAPVALVMPDRLNTDEGYSVEAASWYNLALDDVARLNGVKP